MNSATLCANATFRGCAAANRFECSCSSGNRQALAKVVCNWQRLKQSKGGSQLIGSHSIYSGQATTVRHVKTCGINPTFLQKTGNCLGTCNCASFIGDSLANCFQEHFGIKIEALVVHRANELSQGQGKVRVKLTPLATFLVISEA